MEQELWVIVSTVLLSFHESTAHASFLAVDYELVISMIAQFDEGTVLVNYHQRNQENLV